MVTYALDFERELAKTWKHASVDNLEMYSESNRCREVLEASERFGRRVLECNPLVLKCQLAHSKSKGDITDFHLQLVDRFDYPKVETWGVKVELFFPEKRTLFFPSRCHEVLSPAGYYPLIDPEQNHQGPSYWEFGEYHTWWVDKFQVTSRDVSILDYFKSSRDEVAKSKLWDQMLDYQTLTNLDENKMAGYCHYFGKEILNSDVFNALSFLPRDPLNLYSLEFSFSPFYWSQRRDELSRMTNLKESCSYIMTRECSESFSRYLDLPSIPTWFGIYQVQGGHLEFLSNTRRPRDNIFPSSIYFPKDSVQHFLGKRVYWDGQGHDFRNFNWRGISPEDFDEFRVAFRCMKRFVPR